ncbi:YkuS family protein [Natronincola ferrireducens]|uniref:Uncharacterized protein family (UPF0180) n=1 Tax=Natronincola ferrireducens TaxID=393762 RepID=A0A1G9HQH6_9FIRM|nr:YkuS family protein [Natronincola ferrireducens]SDL15112.1 Uncharacterised protein family (UPF0180) [Natronincola ferrireducens]
MKRIAIQENLQQLKDNLTNKGYEVVGFQDQGHIDAIIYLDDYSGFKNVNDAGETNGYGAILINANNKTVEEIQHIIETRRYGGLFS